ncbi:MAG: response regulator [Deltaproteobacteria bacterium]|nr:response regulator [Deltaproteobacteria bacterium]
MQSSDGTVHIVDDDAELREYVRWVVQKAGLEARVYEDAAAFLAAYVDDGPGCVVTDLYMPGMTGLELQRELAARGVRLPLIMMSAQGEIDTAVQAMRDGAIDFIEKPFAPERLLERVRGALAADAAARQGDVERERVAARFARLTPRQRAVLDGLIEGKPSKIIAADLGLSPRTVDVHRFRIMHVLGAESLPDLFRLVVLVRGSKE